MNKPSGRYTLVSHGTYSKGGAYTPSSQHLQGEINYAPDGTLSLLIRFKDEPQTPKDVLSYVGTYKVASPTEVHHIISLSSAKKLIGTTEVRTMHIEGDTLTLGKLLPDDETFRAVWKKM